LGSRSSPEKTATSRVKILIVIGIAAVGLIASLMVIGAVATSYLNPGKEWPRSPQQQNDEQILAKRVRELPEVQTFFSIYPNVTVDDNGNSGSSAEYFFSSYRPNPYLEDGIVLGLILRVDIDKVPDQKDIQAGFEKQYGDYYYSTALFCGPYSPEDSQRSWFPQRLWDKSRALCPDEKAAMNSTIIQIAS
jgi:hypothetical protein